MKAVSPIRLARSPALLSLLIGILLISGCASSRSQSDEETKVIRIKGSDTMLLLVNRWAEAFMKLNPDIAIYVEGGGTGTGIRALIEGDVELSSASRSLRPSEVQRLLEKRGSLGLSILTAKDALSVYLNPGNPVNNLTIAQLKAIFSGSVSNWKDVGGIDMPITVVGRPPNSGTYLFFREHVLDGDPYGPSTETVPTTSAVIRFVKSQPGAIGYGGLAYGSDVTHCAIEGVEPTAENVRSGSYPIARYLYLFSAAPPEGAIKAFTDWVLSNAGQEVVREVGYVPLWELPEE
ncbi:phosphate ABC transporter substrate-binding protein [bacterium]|nr:phosphate ABC transporter substrate-binding protein [bacterium]